MRLRGAGALMHTNVTRSATRLQSVADRDDFGAKTSKDIFRGGRTFFEDIFRALGTLSVETEGVCKSKKKHTDRRLG